MKYLAKALKRKKERGFTLIELLVVIAIIGILSSVVLASLNGARSKSRDAKRLSDLKQVQSAINMYFNDNGSYPPSGNAWHGNCSGYGSYGTTGATGYIQNLAPTYIKELPIDPKQTASGCYLYKSGSPSEYMYLVYGTVEGVVPDSLKWPAHPTSNSYSSYTPGATSY